MQDPPDSQAALTRPSLLAAVDELRTRDADLAAIVAQHGAPPLWAREPGFPTLVLIILEQQVSLASARAAFDRLTTATDPLTPERLLHLSDAALKQIGFSRQKAAYAQGLARAIVEGSFDPAALPGLSDDEVRAELIRLKGIGPWSADVYLLMALGRPDVWPAGDLALQIAAQEVKGLAGRPSAGELLALAELWRPWRSVAARILWQHYLNR
jgi:DNA-3-methyladenine glycosylase II